MKTSIFICTLTGCVVLLAVFAAGPTLAGMYYEDHEITVPENLYYIEGTGSYYLPGQGADTFFNIGKWYRYEGDEWFISDDLDGPWSGILPASLPRDLAELPADFRETRKLGMIPYRYVIGPQYQDEGYYYRYYSGDYYEEFEHRGYHERRRSYRTYRLYVEPYDYDWYYTHRKYRY